MKNNVNIQGPGFFTILTLIFITLKLTSIITWSWFWVLSPILIPLMITGVVLLVIVILMIIGALFG